MMEGGSDGERETPQDISSPPIAEKYRVSADITNAALRFLLARVVPGADALELCLLGDAFICNETKKVYQKKDRAKRKVEKGIAVPTSISVNEVFANASPCERGASRLLHRGDMVKVDLGTHIDGFVATAAYTVVCCSGNAALFESGNDAKAGAEAVAAASAHPAASVPLPDAACAEQERLRLAEGAQPVDVISGARGAVLKACWLATEAALRKMEVGCKASAVGKIVEKVGAQLGVSPMQGVVSHQLKQHVVEGSRCFPLVVSSGDEKHEDITFEANEVYALDVVFTTGDGKAREAETRPTIFRRNVERKYILKSQYGRAFMNQVENNFPTLPFSARQLQDERASRVGIAEAMRHELLIPYPVMTDKAGEITAQFKVTVLLTPGGTKKATGLPLAQERLITAPEIQCEELKALLATSLNPKKNKKKSKEEASAAAAPQPAMQEA